jgi:hypothetical protein
VIGAGVRPPDPGGVRPVQRHPEAVQRAPGARQAVQALRHEEVSEQCQQGDETPVPRPKVHYLKFQLDTYMLSQKRMEQGIRKDDHVLFTAFGIGPHLTASLRNDDGHLPFLFSLTVSSLCVRGRSFVNVS